MKARCIKLLDAIGNPQERSPWLTLGKVYHVLEVVQDMHKRWLLRVPGDGRDGVGLFPLEQFEIVSVRIPDAWVVDWSPRGTLTLTTEAWSKPGFWEAFYDMDSTAQRIFEEEKQKIVDVDP